MEEASHQRGLAELASLRRQRGIEVAHRPRATWFVRFARVVGFTAIFIGVTLLILTLTAYFD